MRSLADRLAASSKLAPNGCLEWQRPVSKKGGYGYLSVNGGTQRAHRMAWQLANGPIPVGMFICHRCDNPKCINVEHLFLGTHDDNMADMVAKGRHVSTPGEKSVNAILTDALVISILADRRPYREIASEIGVTVSAISFVKNGRSWKHIPREMTRLKPASDPARHCPNTNPGASREPFHAQSIGAALVPDPEKHVTFEGKTDERGS